MAKMILNGDVIGSDKDELIQAKSTTQIATAPVIFTGTDSVIRPDANDTRTYVMLKAANTTSASDVVLFKSDHSVTSLQGAFRIIARSNNSGESASSLYLRSYYSGVLEQNGYKIPPCNSSNVGSATAPAYITADDSTSGRTMFEEEPNPLYIHQIFVQITSQAAHRFDLINSSKDEISTGSDLCAALYNAGYRSKESSVPVSGWYYGSDSIRFRVYSVYSPTVGTYYSWSGKNSTAQMSFTNPSVTDNVIQIY